jgi:hypothetical protein
MNTITLNVCNFLKQKLNRLLLYLLKKVDGKAQQYH